MTAEQDAPAAALLALLSAAGVRATLAPGCEPRDDDAPLFVLLEVVDGADAALLHAAAAHAAETWPGALLVACRRPAPSPARAPAPRLDAAALQRLGFAAVADEPAQVPALLRELEDSGATAEQPTAHSSVIESEPPASLALPTDLRADQLRATFQAVAALHFVADQRAAAQTALAGLAPLVRADRWVLYLTEETRGAESGAARGAQTITFEPLALRGQLSQGSDAQASDWRRTLTGGDPLLALTGSESRAARAAHAANEPVGAREDGACVLALPLAHGGRVLGVVEAARAAARPFDERETALLAALAAPLAAALANSARIAEAERLSLTDDLTKLHNARFLRQYLTSEIRRARRYGSAVTALFLDLDDFKEVNDRHGHLVGSHVLMELATVILTGVRDTDVVVRYGGDEFVVVLPETNAEQALLVAERIREKIECYAFTGGRRLRLRLTASFGLASFPAHAQSPQQILAAADAAMYEAKAARKNCVRLADGRDGAGART